MFFILLDYLDFDLINYAINTNKNIFTKINTKGLLRKEISKDISKEQYSIKIQ